MAYQPVKTQSSLASGLKRALLLPSMARRQYLLRKEYLLLVFATACWAINHSINKIILRELTPFHILVARNWIGTVVLFLILIATRRASSLYLIKGTTWLQLLGLAFIGYVLSGSLNVSALQWIPASINSLLLNTSPIFLALASPLFLREKVSLRAAIGVALAFAGVFIVVFGNSGLTGLPPLNPLGVVLSLSGSICWAAYTAGGRKVMRHQEATTAVMVMTFFAGCIMVPIVLATDGFEPIWRASLTTQLLLLFEGSIVTGLSQTLWYYALKRLEATRVAVFQYLVPVFAVIFANALLAEPITIPLVAGLVAIISGIRLVQATESTTTNTTKIVAR